MPHTEPLGLGQTREGAASSPERRAIPQISENPIGALGLLLGNIGAGIQGRELPTRRRQRAAADLAAQQEASQLRRAELTLKAATQFKNLSEDLDDDARTALANQISTATQGIVPVDLLELVGQIPRLEFDEAAILFPDPENLKRVMTATDGKTEDVLGLIKDKEFMAGLKADTWARNRPAMVRLFNEGTRVVEGMPPERRNELMQRFGGKIDTPSDVIGLSDLLAEFDPRFALDELQRKQIQEDQQLQLAAGLTPTEARLAGAKAAAERPTPEEIFATTTARGQAEARIVDEFADAPDEFNRNLAKYRELVARGEEGSMTGQFLLARLNRQTAVETGEIITVGPDGGITIVRGGDTAALITGLSAQKALQQKALSDRYDTVLDILDTTISLIQEDPTRAGIIGGIRAFAQGLAGVTVDTVEGLATFVGTSIADIPGIDKDDVTKLAGFFDPALPEMEIYENTIALELAKVRILSGGQGIRALTKAFEAAKEDVNIVGVFSSREALSRLQAVRREMETERTKLLRRTFNLAIEPSSQPTVVPEFTLNLATGRFERSN